MEKIADFCLCTDELGKAYWKPDLKAFKLALDFFKADPQEAVYIGDNPSKDFIGPNTLNMRSVKIERPFGVYHHITSIDSAGRPQFIIKDLKELLALDMH